MTLGEKLKTIESFIYQSAKQSFGVFGVDADPALALLVIEGVSARFRQEAADATLNELFALEDKLDREQAQTEKQKEPTDE